MLSSLLSNHTRISCGSPSAVRHTASASPSGKNLEKMGPLGYIRGPRKDVRRTTNDILTGIITYYPRLAPTARSAVRCDPSAAAHQTLPIRDGGLSRWRPPRGRHCILGEAAHLTLRSIIRPLRHSVTTSPSCGGGRSSAGNGAMASTSTLLRYNSTARKAFDGTRGLFHLWQLRAQCGRRRRSASGKFAVSLAGQPDRADRYPISLTEVRG